MTYSVEKRIDDAERDSISVPGVPAPVGDSITGATVATVTITSDCEPGSSDCEPGSESGELEVHQPVSGNVLDGNAITGISVPVGVPASSTIVSSPDSSTSLSSLNDEAPAQVYHHASLSALVADDGRPYLGVTPTPIDSTRGPNASSGMSSDVPSAKPIQSADLDSLDFSKVPAWLCPPLAHLQKDFRGELEDKILGAYVALEMAWQPVSAPLFYSYTDI